MVLACDVYDAPWFFSAGKCEVDLTGFRHISTIMVLRHARIYGLGGMGKLVCPRLTRYTGRLALTHATLRLLSEPAG